ncbi:MAG: hypothetical protein UW24_C0020G0001, partial [Parcubacteria group bacterium GW2011_GWA2_44_12]
FVFYLGDAVLIYFFMRLFKLAFLREGGAVASMRNYHGAYCN